MVRGNGEGVVLGGVGKGGHQPELRILNKRLKSAGGYYSYLSEIKEHMMYDSGTDKVLLDSSD